MTSHSAADVKAVKDYLADDLDVLYDVLRCYDGEYGTDLAPMDRDDVLSYVYSLADEKDSAWDVFDMGARTGATWDEISRWPFAEVAWDGDDRRLVGIGWDRAGEMFLDALDRYPIAEFVLDGEVYWIDDVGEFLRKARAYSSGNCKAAARKPSVGARKPPAKRKAPQRGSGTSKAKKPAAGRPGAKKAPAKRYIAKTSSKKVRK